MLLEGKITILWSVSGGITCWARRYHSPSVINNQSWNCDHLHQAKGYITCSLKDRLLTYGQYLVGSPAEPGDITHLPSLIINLEIAITYTKQKVRSLAVWRWDYLLMVSIWWDHLLSQAISLAFRHWYSILKFRTPTPSYR